MSYNFYKASQEAVASQEGIAKAQQRKITPAGIYNAILQGVEESASKSSSARGTKFTYLIAEGPERGNKVSETLWHTNRDGGPIQYAMQKLFSKLKVFGYTDKTLANFQFPSNEKDPGDFVKIMGKPVTLVVENKVQTQGAGAGQLRAEVIRVTARVAGAAEADSTEAA